MFQLIGLGLVHLSTDLIEISTCVIIFLVAYKLMAEKVLLQIQKIRYGTITI